MKGRAWPDCWQFSLLLPLGCCQRSLLSASIIGRHMIRLRCACLPLSSFIGTAFSDIHPKASEKILTGKQCGVCQAPGYTYGEFQGVQRHSAKLEAKASSTICSNKLISPRITMIGIPLTPALGLERDGVVSCSRMLRGWALECACLSVHSVLVDFLEDPTDFLMYQTCLWAIQPHIDIDRQHQYHLGT